MPVKPGGQEETPFVFNRFYYMQLWVGGKTAAWYVSFSVFVVTLKLQVTKRSRDLMTVILEGGKTPGSRDPGCNSTDSGLTHLSTECVVSLPKEILEISGNSYRLGPVYFI